MFNPGGFLVNHLMVQIFIWIFHTIELLSWTSWCSLNFMLKFNHIGSNAWYDEAPGVKNCCSIYLNWHTHTHAYHISTKIQCNRITLFNVIFRINSVGYIWPLPYKIECNIGIEFLPFLAFMHNEQVCLVHNNDNNTNI